MNLAQIRKLNPNFFDPTFLNCNATYKVVIKEGVTYLIETSTMVLSTQSFERSIVWEIRGENDFFRVIDFGEYGHFDEAVDFLFEL